MKYRTLTLSIIATFAGFAVLPTRADNMVSIAIAPTTGVVTLVPRWSIGENVAGFHLKSQDTGFSVGANNFYSINGTDIPMGGDIAAFTYYNSASGFATNLADVGSKLTPNSYSALTSADPDLGFGAINFYFIHHKGTTDYLSEIVPGSGTSSAVTDLKPMSGPGGPATVTGLSGYFGLTFAAADLGYGANLFYYLRTDETTGFTQFGMLTPALLSGSADLHDLGLAGHNAITFTGTDVGYGTDKMYFVRLDPVTGFTILGTLNPLTGKAEDIANLGSVYSTLDFVPGDIGFSATRFYTTGVVNPTWQSVSFAAIPDRALLAGSFTVTPSASSGLPIVLTVFAGSATISEPVMGVYTVTPSAPGLITLQASQAGQLGLYEANMLRQSFTVTGAIPDFNADSKADLVLENTATGARGFWLMNGTAVSSWVGLPRVWPAWRIAAKADFNGDGKPDLLWENTVTGDRRFWMMNGTSIASTEYMTNLGTAWRFAGAADFNGDGMADIILENTVTGTRGFWLMNRTNVSSWVHLATIDTDWRIAGAADFNTDGYVDIVLENTVTGTRGFWLMNRTAVSSWVHLDNIETDWRIATSSDFDGDGMTDIVLENTVTGTRGFWLMNGTNVRSWVHLSNLINDWRITN